MIQYLSVPYDTIGRILGCRHIRRASFCTQLKKQFVIETGDQSITVPFSLIEEHFTLPTGFHIVDAVIDPVTARSIRFSMEVLEIPTAGELPFFPVAFYYPPEIIQCRCVAVPIQTRNGSSGHRSGRAH